MAATNIENVYFNYGIFPDLLMLFFVNIIVCNDIFLFFSQFKWLILKKKLMVAHLLKTMVYP